MFKGAMTAIITPFKDGRIDEESLRALIDWQISNGIDAIVACGTTGEGVTLTPEEHYAVIRIAVEQAAGRVGVMAGAGSNSTANAIKFARKAKEAGADGMLQVTPYYNKPTQEGLYQHFRAIAGVVDLPMVLYNVPGRTCVNMLPETTARLAAIDSIIGIKEACGNLGQIKEVISKTPDDFAVFSGDDAMNYDIYRAGGKGAISVTANVVPDRVAAVWDAHELGNDEESMHLHKELATLNKVMFIETNPIPAKTTLAIMGRCNEEFRLPLTPMGEGHRNELIDVLKENGVIA
ncbi:MAG: 4-hydroxy-tetrahydrodipicolinate synthase [Pseudomonadota bacterium]